MKKVYYLSTCDTCTRILNKLKLPSAFIKQDVKSNPLTDEQLEELYNMAGSYEALLNKRARKYQERDLKNEELDDEAIANLLMEHYTFLKRPVIVNKGEIFIGNSKKTVQAAQESIHGTT